MVRTHRTLHASTTLLAFLGAAGVANAQGFNVDIDSPFGPLPPVSSSYAAAGTPGVWNGIDPTLGIAHPLVDKAGSATGVTMQLSAGLIFDLQFDNVNMTGDDANLLEDIVYGGTNETVTFSGLANGTYEVLTYAIAPDNKLGFLTDVGVVGSPDPVQIVGGQPWAGVHQPSVSYARHFVVVTSGTVTIDIAINFGDMSLNGIQIEPAGSSGSAYCFGDGSGAACPCGGFGGSGEGCLTTSGSGALLSAAGSANVVVDSLTLSVTGAPANKPGLFFQGNNQLANPVGDGLLCASGGTVRYPVNPTDATGSVSQMGLNLNASAGQTVNYQYWFRDTGNSCGGGFNFSNGWTVTWN